MSQQKHTPGPWQIHVRNSHRLHIDGDEIIITQQDKEKPVAFLHPLYLSLAVDYALKGRDEPRTWEQAVQEVKANTALIAAAPELLAACKAAALVLQSNDGAICDTVWMPDGSPETLLDHLLAAIAKAEGRAS